MKKVSLLLLAMILVFTMIACGVSEDGKQSYNSGYKLYDAYKVMGDENNFDKAKNDCKTSLEAQKKSFDEKLFKQGWDDAKAGKKPLYEAKDQKLEPVSGKTAQ